MNASRDTKYSKTILSTMGRCGHATNAELLSDLRGMFPTVSATTVHRATARLLDNGQLFAAPASKQGSMRYDMTAAPHDHFICTHCDGIRNIDISSDFLPKLNSALGGCRATGRLVIYGSCERCLREGEKE